MSLLYNYVNVLFIILLTFYYHYLFILLKPSEFYCIELKSGAATHYL